MRIRTARDFYRAEPRFISAKFDSVCKETGKTIKKGQECLYFPQEKAVYCLDSKACQDFRSMKFDESLGGF